MPDPKLIHLGPCEVGRLDVINGQPELAILDAGGVAFGTEYPAASIVLRGADNLRRLADALAPYATPPQRWLPSTPEAMVAAAAGAKCACPSDESETCWRCVARHILSLTPPSK